MELHVGDPEWESWSEAVGNCAACADLPGEDEFCSGHDPTDPDVIARFRGGK